jgi:hypothetical protein
MSLGQLPDQCIHCGSINRHHPECPMYTDPTVATSTTPFNIRLWDWCVLRYRMPVTWEAFLLTCHTLYTDTYQPTTGDQLGYLPLPWKRRDGKLEVP